LFLLSPVDIVALRAAQKGGQARLVGREHGRSQDCSARENPPNAGVKRIHVEQRIRLAALQGSAYSLWPQHNPRPLFATKAPTFEVSASTREGVSIENNTISSGR
jgi:hypothetical protein